MPELKGFFSLGPLLVNEDHGTVSFDGDPIGIPDNFIQVLKLWKGDPRRRVTHTQIENAYKPGSDTGTEAKSIRWLLLERLKPLNIPKSQFDICPSGKKAYGLRLGSSAGADGNETTLSVAHLRVAVGIVVRDGKVILVKRRASEYGLLWQFPAGVVKPLEDPGAALCDEIQAETGVATRIVAHLGSRLHPDTHVHCEYFHCHYLHGMLINQDTAENSDVQWVKISEIEKYLTSDLFVNVRKLLSLTKGKRP